ncbi:MAG: DNA alkylation repair protein [Bacteroidia bacterium]|nr:DNA alkylation repair protein [Bacteroidia bacterium]
MKLSAKAKDIYSTIAKDTTKLGDLRKIAKTIKKDHDLAMELWSTGEFHPRLLAILIMDNKLLSQDFINQLTKDIEPHDQEECNQIFDWLMANQLTKSKRTIGLMESWNHSPFAIQRRIFWYYQARLRWMGKNPADNTEALLSAIENSIKEEAPEVQWAMNFTAAQIGIHEADQRKRCISLGENTGLYKDEIVPRGCTPSYLPEFIRIEVDKIKKR